MFLTALSPMSGNFSSLKLTVDIRPVDRVPQYCLCIFCNKLLKDAMQTVCGCRICKPCSEMYLANEDPRDCPGRLSDCQEISLQDGSNCKVFPDNATRRAVANIRVHCSNKDCSETIELKLLISHLNQCPYTLVQCELCKMDVLRRDKEDHDQSQCDERRVTCAKCNASFPWRQERSHYNLSSEDCCPIFEGPCPFCNTGLYDRSTLSSHSSECLCWELPCEYSNVGCRFIGIKSEREKHIKNDEMAHLMLAVKKVESLSTDIEKLQRKETLMKAQLSDILKKANKTFTLAETTEVQANDYRENVVRLEASGGLRNLMLSSQQESSIAVAPSDLGSMSAQLEELSERILLSETARDGVYIWRINDYRARKSRAESGEQIAFNSPPFYTNQVGYKMCMRIYLFGDGVGRGSHVSLFFAIMRGEYDLLLSWPFQQKVTLLLMDQDNGHEHMSESFRPDPSSACNQRPASTSNTASGCPRFVSHRTLEGTAMRSRYLKNDTMFVKMIVDTSNLSRV